MKAITRIEQCLAMALASAEDPSCPPKLAGAVRHAVFPGGARIRPNWPWPLPMLVAWTILV